MNWRHCRWSLLLCDTHTLLRWNLYLDSTVFKTRGFIPGCKNEMLYGSEKTSENEERGRKGGTDGLMDGCMDGWISHHIRYCGKRSWVTRLKIILVIYFLEITTLTL